MRRVRLAVTGAMSIVLVLISACSQTGASRPPATSSNGHSIPGVVGPSSVPTPPSPETVTTVVLHIPVVPGSRIDCAQLPFPGSIQFEYQVHDCWYVDLAGTNTSEMFEFFLSGSDPTNRQQGVVLFQRNNSVGHTTYSVPGRNGNISIYLARWEFACFTVDSTGVVGMFDADTATFEKDQSRIAAECPKP